LNDDGYALERSTVRRAFDRAAPRYDDAADLQREIADELLERLAPVRVDPATIADLGCGTGYATRGLQRLYRGADVIGIDFAPEMARRAPGNWRPGRRPVAVCADVQRLPLPDASVDILFSNLTFQWVHDLRGLFTELRRVLRPEGVLMFSSFGPDTLVELRDAWAAVDNDVHVHQFPDMHDVGDALLAAGFTDPVMDVDRQRRAYPDLRALMRALKGIGASNAAAGRGRGLRGRGALDRLARAYAALAEDGRPLASWELVYGHAWGASTPRAARGDAREYHVPLESIGHMGRGSGASGGRGSD